MLELMQTGIIDRWDLWFRPMLLKCMGNIRTAHTTETSKTLKQKNQPPSLSLKNLTGAFVVLSVGFGISFLVFLSELIIAIPSRHRRRIDETRNQVEREMPIINQEVGAVSKELEHEIY
jgi:glutamate receptor, ionotropic, invertebrate